MNRTPSSQFYRSQLSHLPGDRGHYVTVKSEALTALPLGVVTLIVPDVAAAGTLILICVSESERTVAAAPLIATFLGFSRFDPEMVTLEPGAPDPGENPLMLGGPPVTVYWSEPELAA